MRLHDGRRLAFDVYGPEHGHPVIYCHGSPGSRVEWPLLANDETAARADVRVIVPDRPGIGGSDPRPGRRFLDWPADVTALADALEVDRFSVLGISGGCPYALACGAGLAGRVASIGILGGAAPYDVPGLTDGMNADALRTLRLSASRPGVFRLIWRVIGLVGRLSPRLMARQAASVFAAADQAILREPAFARRFATMLRAVLQQGVSGLQQDVALMVSPWEFDPAQVTVPAFFWQGDQDTDVPPAMACFLAGRIRGAQVRMFAGEGHISLAVHHLEQALRALVESGRRAA
jgi:pimeloyl-ACP methyl ester carboxylesterase